MTTLRLILGDQLSDTLSSLRDIAEGDLVLMAEVREEASYVRHHKRKIAFVFSAMRHFAARLEERGINVRYTRYDDPHNAGSLLGEVKRALEAHALDDVVITSPGEYRLVAEMKEWQRRLNTPVNILDDDRFIASTDWFNDWAEGRKSLRMEFFYREMRRATGILMTDAGEPEGGQWNYDQENRKSPPADLDPPSPKGFRPDAITDEVLALVASKFDGHFGSLDDFGMPVTVAQAEEVLDAFIEERLEQFGDYQDAMVTGQPTMYHSLISAALNAGLLDPLTVCKRAERAYYEDGAPLNAVEGFIRQILGWREFIRGVYWYKMPDYAEMNFLGADRPLPAFYWTAQTDMVCLREAVEQTRDLAYAHHIQRLMVLGNFALLAGIAPEEINEWFLVVYYDAYEWVELPNVHGMAIFADGGVFASKPYAASGKYIDRMSTYCKGCKYDVKKPTGEASCPFNYLYWDFLSRNRNRLKGNQRLGMIYKTLDRMTDQRRDDIRESARAFLDGLEPSGESYYVRARRKEQAAE